MRALIASPPAPPAAVSPLKEPVRAAVGGVDIYAALAGGDAATIADSPVGGGESASVANALQRWRGGDPVGGLADLRDAVEHPRQAAAAWLSLAPALDPDSLGPLVSLTKFNPSDVPATADANGIVMSASAGERNRLVVPILADGERFEVHLLISLVGPAAGQPVVALRLLHGNHPEEVVLTFRNGHLLLLGMIEIPLEWPIAPRLLSLAVDGGGIRIDVDGVPVWIAPRRQAVAATGINLDVIGVVGGTTRLAVHWLRIGPLTIPPLDGVVGESGLKLAQAMLHERLAEPKARDLGPALEAFRSLPLEASRVEQAARRMSQLESAYPAHVLASLSERLGPGADPDIVTPQEPVVEVSAIDIELAANAGRKSVADLLLGRKKATLKILDGISFEAYRGDVVGIIGKNGAGKSTLLRAIIGAVPISNGRIGVRGHPVLLRPGAGMQTELTGRENIMQAGLYMGLTPKGVRAIVDDVIEFSELGVHIDRPYQYYSDGMRARLVFALATSISPEILMLDELLSAGDIGFQEKAAQRLDTFIRRAHVVFVVQHGMDFVMTRCTKCLYIKGGRQAYFGDPRIAAEMYQSDL